jgi:uncharacterized membrane protein
MKLDRNLKIITLTATFIGLADSIYLTWIKFSHTEAACLPGIGNCDLVNTSKYSEVYGIPIALLGGGVYLIIFLLNFFEKRTNDGIDIGRLALFALSLFGVLYSAYLTYIEFGILKTFCPFCLLSAFILLIIFIITVIRMTLPQPD